MSYQERRAIAALIGTILITTTYSAFMMQRYPHDAGSYSAEVLHFWGAFILILVPVSIIAKIIIAIVFSIINAIATRESEVPIMDERDRLVELKAARNALYVFSAGFLLAMGTLVINLPPSAMFITLICAGTVSDIVSDISQFYFYRGGTGF